MKKHTYYKSKKGPRKEPKEYQCVDCKKMFALREVEIGPDPFEHEVYGIIGPRIVLCHKCYKERVWDT
jgi:hypothetical protein